MGKISSGRIHSCDNFPFSRYPRVVSSFRYRRVESQARVSVGSGRSSVFVPSWTKGYWFRANVRDVATTTWKWSPSWRLGNFVSNPCKASSISRSSFQPRNVRCLGNARQSPLQQPFLVIRKHCLGRGGLCFNFIDKGTSPGQHEADASACRLEQLRQWAARIRQLGRGETGK